MIKGEIMKDPKTRDDSEKPYTGGTGTNSEWEETPILTSSQEILSNPDIPSVGEMEDKDLPWYHN